MDMSDETLLLRINQKLEGQLRRTFVRKTVLDWNVEVLGEYHLIEARSGALVQTHVNLRELGRRLQIVK